MNYNKQIEVKVIEIADFMISHTATTRQAAWKYNVSKSTVHNYITKRLYHIDRERFDKIQELLKYNYDNRGNVGSLKFRESWDTVYIKENGINRNATDIIKFRVYDYISKQLYYYEDGLVVEFTDKYVCAKINHNKLTDIDIMRYTGLCDRMGKEIYEKDILFMDNKEYTVNDMTIHGLVKLQSEYANRAIIVGNEYTKR